MHLLTTPLAGQLNQAELSVRIDSFILTPSGETEHLHNQLVAAIYGNVTREMPDQGVASWVSANDKPTTGAGSKPVSGDAAEQRLKVEVMQLPSRDRRRLKDISQNDVSYVKPRCIYLLALNSQLTHDLPQFDPFNALPDLFGEVHRKKPLKTIESVPSSAGGLSKTSKFPSSFAIP